FERFRGLSGLDLQSCRRGNHLGDLGQVCGFSLLKDLLALFFLPFSSGPACFHLPPVLWTEGFPIQAHFTPIGFLRDLSLPPLFLPGGWMRTTGFLSSSGDLFHGRAISARSSPRLGSRSGPGSLDFPGDL